MFRQAICLSRSSNWGDDVQAGADLVTLHCFAWPRIAADDVQTGMLVLRHRERCPNGESCTGRLASCGHGQGEEAGGGKGSGRGRRARGRAHAAGADPSRSTPLPRLRGVPCGVLYSFVFFRESFGGGFRRGVRALSLESSVPGPRSAERTEMRIGSSLFIAHRHPSPLTRRDRRRSRQYYRTTLDAGPCGMWAP